MRGLKLAQVNVRATLTLTLVIALGEVLITDERKQDSRSVKQ